MYELKKLNLKKSKFIFSTQYFFLFCFFNPLFTVFNFKSDDIESEDSTLDLLTPYCNIDLFKNVKMLNYIFSNIENTDEVEKNLYSCFFFTFLLKYFQKKSQKNIFFFLKKLSFLNFFYFDNSYEDLLTFLEKKFKKYQMQIGRGFFLKEFFECFIFFLFFKDATFFSNWFKRTCERIDFKKHKKFFYFLSVFFSKYFFFFSQPYGVCGFRLSVAGKISLTGSAKKKSFLLRVGSFSSVKKSLKMSYTSNFIWTSQGALGFKVGLFFN